MREILYEMQKKQVIDYLLKCIVILAENAWIFA